jgi:hypothetical protein
MAEQAEYKARRRQQLATVAREADEVADQVCEAVRENRFYVLTHAESLPEFDARAQRILAGENPKEPTQ